MDMASVPYTMAYEISKLKEKLNVLNEKISKHPVEQTNILNFEFIRCKKERSEVEENLRLLKEMLQIAD